MAASLPVLNAAIPKKWRSVSNSLHLFRNFDINTNRGSRRLESNEEIQGHNRNDGAGAVVATQNEKGPELSLPDIQSLQGLQDPIPTHREHLCKEALKGEDMV